MTASPNDTLTDDDIAFLQDIIQARDHLDIEQGALILLMLHNQYAHDEIAVAMHIDPQTVEHWASFWQTHTVADLALLKIRALEPRLRPLLPADLYADFWTDPSQLTLERCFNHLRTLLKILHDHVPQHVRERSATPGDVGHKWMSSTLLFTDLAGFTPFMEAHAVAGAEGAEGLLTILNRYFAKMIDIINQSGGTMLEFTGDAILAEFPRQEAAVDLASAIRAGLRMQRAMADFQDIQTPRGVFSLGMRVGVHRAEYLTLDIGTPSRMEHVLLGDDVRQTKLAEGAGKIGIVCITQAAYEQLGTSSEAFVIRQSPNPGYWLIWDMYNAADLGDYDLTSTVGRRFKAPLLTERNVQALSREIEMLVRDAEPLMSYLPARVVSMLVENAGERRIPPNFPVSTVLFAKLFGIAEAVKTMAAGHENTLARLFSRVFTRINAVVDQQDGILKTITYQASGSDILIFFGVPSERRDDVERAVRTAIAIRDIVAQTPPLLIADQEVRLSVRMGLARGAVFAAEIGLPRGRREYNIIGDDVNIAARLMGHQETDYAILVSQAVYNHTSTLFDWELVGSMALKGKAREMPVYGLQNT
ncbi:MAG: adenylate/guanylate cyclase domain-containing protein [Anaerolineales bacterium]